MSLNHEQLNRIVHGLSFEDYMAQWEMKNALPMRGLDPIGRRYRFYSKYNIERQARVDALWEPSQAFIDAVDHAPGPATWLFITDDWCVDSAYSLPLVRWATERRDDLALRILMKDDHLDILDHFLTNGKRSIPKWIGLTETGEVQFSWGPQPEEIRAIRQNLMDSGAEGKIVSSTTVDWYADHGWTYVEKEMIETLRSI